MLRRLTLLVALILAAGLLTVPATAETYTVTLDSGETFLSRYPPREASWDQNVIMLLTEHGNWVGIDRRDIESIGNQTDIKGFGLRISTTTISFGYLANDAPLPDEDGGATPPPFQTPAQRSYDIDQFVEPAAAGGGVPVYGIQSSPSGGDGG